MQEDPPSSGPGEAEEGGREGGRGKEGGKKGGRGKEGGGGEEGRERERVRFECEE